MTSVLLLSTGQTLSAAGLPEYVSSNAQAPGAPQASTSSTRNLGFNNKRLDPQKHLMELRAMLPKTGVQFIDDTVYDLLPRTYYRHADFGNGRKAEAFTTGGSLRLKTGYYEDIAAFGISAYTSQKLYGPDDRDGTGLLQPGQESYSVLGEAYLDLNFNVVNLSLGLQRLDLPYLNTNDSRMTPNTFEAYSLIYNGFGPAQFGLGYVNQFRFRNSTDYISMSEQAGATDSDEGMFAAGVHYDISENFNIGVVNLYTPDTFNTFYMETNETRRLFEQLSVNVAFQFTSQDSVGDELVGDFSTQHYGLKCIANYGKFTGALATTYTSSGGDIRKPWGGSPSFNSIMLADFDRAEEESIGASLSYDFDGPYLDPFLATVKWGYGDTPDNGKNASPDQRELDLNLEYAPPNYDKLKIRLRYARRDAIGSIEGRDIRDFRIIINYAVSF
ncbi:MAG: OprD family outer membrane porin [Coraliomargarita sp.]